MILIRLQRQKLLLKVVHPSHTLECNKVFGPKNWLNHSSDKQTQYWRILNQLGKYFYTIVSMTTSILLWFHLRLRNQLSNLMDQFCTLRFPLIVIQRSTLKAKVQCSHHAFGDRYQNSILIKDLVIMAWKIGKKIMNQFSVPHIRIGWKKVYHLLLTHQFLKPLKENSGWYLETFGMVFIL